METTSPNPHNWSHFVVLANKALKASQPKTYGRFISLMLEPHFYNHAFLQIHWEKDGLNWYRSTWLKDDDAPKFNNPMEQLKYIGKSVSPTLEVESGTVTAQDAEALLNLLRSLSLNPFIDNDGGIVLDGCVHTLTFCTDYSTSCCYVWNYLPDEYKDLQKVVDLLEGICNRK